jgi:hypothetical protein
LQEEKSEGNDAEYYCIVCHEAFSESRSGEDWIQCLLGKELAHDQCINETNKASFICLLYFFDHYLSDSS